MIRTIDGTDYIAMSEVLRIVEDGIRQANIHAHNDRLSPSTRRCWGFVQMELNELRYQLVGTED